MRSCSEHIATRPRVLRVPGALAVAFAGSAMTMAVSYGCDPNTPDPTPDAGRIIEMRGDAALAPDSRTPDDAAIEDGGPPPDADEPPPG
jgi:hypothetical protein